MCASLPNLVIPANAGNLKRDINPASLDSRLVEGDEKNELAHLLLQVGCRPPGGIVRSSTLVGLRGFSASVGYRRRTRPAVECLPGKKLVNGLKFPAEPIIMPQEPVVLLRSRLCFPTYSMPNTATCARSPKIDVSLDAVSEMR